MKALIVDGEELFCLSLKEVVSAAGPFDEVLVAGCESEFVACTAHSKSIDLILFHPTTLNCEGENCLSLARRLYPNATLITLLDPVARTESDWKNTHTIMRSASITQMIIAIRRAMRLPTENLPINVDRIRPHLTPGAVRVGRTQRISSEDAALDVSRLSVRQRQILTMAADGLPNKEIAARLNIAEGTVKAHMHAIFKVMGVSNRTQAVIRFGAAGTASTADALSAAF